MTDEETKRMADLTRRLADTAIDYKQRCEDIDTAFTNLHREYDRRGDRIAELEAKLAKAVAGLEDMQKGLRSYASRALMMVRISYILAELKGQGDD
jgi:chromosome segregation ATPase